MPDSFVQIEKISMRERISHALRAAIISGELEPGTVYSAPSLGTRFGVSATPVREAMLDLVREDLVEIVPNKGFRVTEIGESALDEITELRLLIEPAVVGKVTPSIPSADIDELRELAQKIVDAAAAGNLIEYTEADRIFHVRLLSYAKNGRLTTLVAELRAHARLYGLSALLARGELEQVAREHLTIVDTIERRDPEAVAELLREHISQTRGRWARPAVP
ncbi:MAG: GntR family transcriptional regulator [Pseudonocardia sp.]|nr:GntR family transcriptional regulator [Pseudonocardia sp.]